MTVFTFRSVLAQGCILTHCVFINDPVMRLNASSPNPRTEGAAQRDARQGGGLGEQKPPKGQQRQMQRAMSGAELPRAARQAGGCLVGKELCRMGAGSPSEQQVAYESAVCSCANGWRPVL